MSGRYACGSPNFCVNLGIQTELFDRIFNNFLDLNQVTDIMPFGGKSKNGFIRKLLYNMKYENVMYKMTMILKSVVPTGNPDNLYYEYYAGIALNYYGTLFPFFVNTKGLLAYHDKNSYTSVRNIHIPIDKPIGKWLSDNLHVITGSSLNTQILEKYTLDACKYREKMCLLVEYANDSIRLTNMLNDQYFIKYDFFPIYLLLYSTLSTMANVYTHYDLHAGNVILIPSGNPDGIFEYHMHIYNGSVKTQTLKVYSRYLPKIIDYGRCYFALPPSESTPAFSSYNVRDVLCNVDKYCCANSGFTHLTGIDSSNLAANHYINSSVRNVSHDLQLFQYVYNMFINNNINIPTITRLGQRTVCNVETGTPESLLSYKDNDLVNNVMDMTEFLCQAYLYDHDTYYPIPPPTYKVVGTFDIHFTLSNIISYIAHDFNNIPYIPV